MPIPNADAAHIAPEKLTDYLLNEKHPVGGGKAKWFRQLGFDTTDAAALKKVLLELVQTRDEYTESNSPFGTKYVVSGKITGPNGNEMNVTTVWIIEPSDTRPRLVTAYPGEKP